VTPWTAGGRADSRCDHIPSDAGGRLGDIGNDDSPPERPTRNTPDREERAALLSSSIARQLREFVASHLLANRELLGGRVARIECQR
jgi:hypothetical protein